MPIYRKAMNPYKHQQLRATFDLTWREEYVLGVLAQYGDVKTSFITHIAESENVYRWDNAKRAVDRLVERGFILKEKIDGKTYLLRLAHQGNVYLNYLTELYSPNAFLPSLRHA
jgi:DNA-binding MarR family transcriptional regulator